MQVTKINSDSALNCWEVDELTSNYQRELNRELIVDRLHTLSVLKKLGLPVSAHHAVYFMSDLATEIAKVGSYPIVIKLLDAISEAGTTLKGTICVQIGFTRIKVWRSLS